MKLTSRQVASIASTVRKLDDADRPTWDTVARIAKELTRHQFSRQALEKHSSIKTAYSERVDAYRRRRATGRSETRDADSPPTQENELSEATKRFKQQLEEYDRRLILLVSNATARGISLEELEADLSRRNRGWSDGKGPEAL